MTEPVNITIDTKSAPKVLRGLGRMYIVIVSIINYIGYLVASSSTLPTNGHEDFNIWVAYINSHSVFFTILSVMSFVIPLVVCLVYTLLCSEKNAIRRIINIPIMYALFGSLGWVVSLVLETITLIYLELTGVLHMRTIFLSSLLNMSQICLFISTFAFLVLDVIHRKIFLPRFFPDGQVGKYPGAIHLSSGGLITIFYFSIGLFPIGFLFSILYNYMLRYGFEINIGVYVVLGLIIVFGIAMTISFADHFSSPVRKLKGATREMTNSNYDVSVNVVSSDDFGDLADNFNDMAHSLGEKTLKIRAIQDSIIRGMAVMVEQRDNSTGGHINRTSDCVRVFIDYLQKTNQCPFSPEFCKAMIKAAPMHDLGKIAVDDAILRKPGRFTDEEYAIMKKHPAAGKVIVEHVLSEVEDEQFKQVAVHVAHYHHEKWNGTGYPNGISGTDIPVEARIMALADVFDALVSKRCYKERMSYDKAFSIIEGDLGSHFDPELGALFIKCRPELEALYDSYDSEE